MHITGSERGYLHEKFRLFHTRDQKELKVDWHYHTFDKIVYFLSGHVEYAVESESYRLRPGDLHRAVELLRRENVAFSKVYATVGGNLEERML